MYSYIHLTSRLIVAIVLTTSGAAKWLNFRWFVGVLRKYKLGSDGSAPVIAIVVASLESAVAVGLFWGKFLSLVASAAVAMFFIFTVAVCVKLAKGAFDVPCGCNGFAKKAPIGWQIVFRNLGLIGLACLVGTPREEIGSISPGLFALSVVLLAVPLVWKRRSLARDEAAIPKTETRRPFGPSPELL